MRNIPETGIESSKRAYRYSSQHGVYIVARRSNPFRPKPARWNESKSNCNRICQSFFRSFPFFRIPLSFSNFRSYLAHKERNAVR